MQFYLRLILIWCMMMATSNIQADTSIPAIIPQPQKMKLGSGNFSLTASTRLIVAEKSELTETASYLAKRVFRASGFDLLADKPSDAKGGIIRLSIDSRIKGEEAYTLSVTAEKVDIRAATSAGIFYGIQSLLQLMPPKIFGNSARQDILWNIPFVDISDAPRFGYRGMHLDVGRHFFPVENIKSYIDYLALHKMNRFHWHLTEDQGWRIEIMKYPKLAEVSAWRKETLIGHAGRAKASFKFDGKRYGGYYTQDEVREVVAYAAERHITIIPEIELPGHSLAALAAYPELACTEGPFEVGTYWGVFKDVYCPNEATFTFLQDVLSEVMALFPSKYIHIGGDECPKDRWKESQFCQELIKREGLKDEHELQSWFVRRIEKFLNKNGRKLIGWDEITEGGLSPTATVMFWRGHMTDLPLSVAEGGNNLIMTPTSHCYFDYYQSKRDSEPLAIGGYLPAKKVYEFEPIPTDFPQELIPQISGLQGNVWTEYIPTWKHLQYMVFPRLCAMAEVGWSAKDARDWSDFSSRMNVHFQRLDLLGINYARHMLTAEDDIIRVEHIAKGAGISVTPSPTAKYGSDVNALVDGIQGSAGFLDETWRGFEGFDFSARIDLGSQREIKELSAGFLSDHGSWIFLPTDVRFSVSTDGKRFSDVGSSSYNVMPDTDSRARREYRVSLEPTTARYIHLDIKTLQTCPEWHSGAGGKAWVFIDEITVK